MERLKQFSLPLLAKELVELSARPRTYQVRVAYAAILLLISWIVLFNSIPFGASSPLDVLGRGLIVMHAVGYLQNIGLQFVLPAIACGVFTIEKERNTLSLLFLTRLGPWTILFEKLLSRILLAFGFLIISLPLLSFCYALGGITIDHLLAQFLSLLITSVSIVSISVLCSTYFRTTSAALIGSYVLIYLTRLFLLGGIYGMLTGSRAMSWDTLWGVLVMGGIYVEGSPFQAWIGSSYLLTTAILSVPWLLISALYVLLARWFLVRRAFLTPRNPIKELFQRLDRLFELANNNPLTRGIVVIRHSERLPGDQPVAWRETTTRSIGQARYLIRILLVLEAPVLVMLLRYAALGNQRLLINFSTAVQVLMWLGMTLVVCVLSAGLISGERGRQSLDVLLATPMTGREIIRQKLAGVLWLIWICEVPLWTCLLFRFLVDHDIVYVLCHASMLLIYPRAVAWLAMWYGLRSKTAIMAVVKSLLAVLWRCLGPFVLIYLMVMLFFFQGGPGNGLEELLALMSLASPVTLFVVCEFSRENGNSDLPLAFQPVAAMFMNSIIHGGLLLWVWYRCLDRADVLLGRTCDVVNGFPVADEVRKLHSPQSSSRPGGT